MPTPWITVRVFISSTFLDMHAERDYLVRFVFPRLREELLKRHIHFDEMDLRWGVASEGALGVCREIVEECRPRFLCLLGGRYGEIKPSSEFSLTQEEVNCAVLDRLGQHGYAFFYFRDPTATESIIEQQPGEFRDPPGSRNKSKLVAFKNQIEAAGLKPFVYPARWDNARRRLIELKALGSRVYEDLLSSVQTDPQLKDRFGASSEKKLDERDKDEFDEESAVMETFVEERTKRFVLGSREPVLGELLDHTAGTGNDCYACVIGEPGSGKSTLLAYLSKHPALSNQPAILLIRHFVGASTGSSDVRRTLRRLCHELITRTGITAEIPDEPEKLRAAFPEILNQACARKRVVILLDAVNQFDAAPHFAGLWWLPHKGLPDNARFILSTMPGPALDDLRRRPYPPHEIALPPLIRADVDAITDEFLHRYRKNIEPEERESLLGKDASGKLQKADADKPLYLLTALEELRTLGTPEETRKRILEMPGETQGLFTWILNRLENDDGFRDASSQKIGRELVIRFASLMGISRHGLSLRELVELLAPGDPKAKPPILDDAQGNVVALVRLLRPYLMLRGELMDFFHPQFRSAVEKAYLKTDEQRQSAHEDLADYFKRKVDPRNDGSWSGRHKHGLSELPYHQARCGLWTALEQTLANLDFLQTKTQADLGYDVLQDFVELYRQIKERATAVAASHEQETAFREYATAFRQTFHAFSLHPEITAQQLYNNLWGRVPDWSSVVQRLSQWRKTHQAGGTCWLGRLNRAPETSLPGEWQRTLSGHAAPVLCLALSPDEKWLASGGQDGRVLVWSTDIGSEAAHFETGESPVRAVGWVLPSEGSKEEPWIAVARADGFISLWDWRSGTQLARWVAHSAALTALAVSDGLLFSTGLDRQLKAWVPGKGTLAWSPLTGAASPLCLVADPEERMLLYAGEDPSVRAVGTDRGRSALLLSGHLSSTRCLALDSPQHRVLSGADDQTVRLWDLQHGSEILALSGHSGRVTAVAFAQYSTDRRETRMCGVSAGIDETIRLWDLDNAEALRLLPGHPGGTNALVASVRSPWMASAGEEGNVRLWDLSSVYSGGRANGGHRGRVNCIVASPKSQLLITASDDHTARVWAEPAFQTKRVHRMHRRPVKALSIDEAGQAYSGGGDGLIYVWDPNNGEVLKVFGNPLARSATAKPEINLDRLPPEVARLPPEQVENVRKVMETMARPVGHGSSVTSLLALDGNRLISAGRDGTVRLWNTETRDEVCVVKAGCGPIHTLLYEPTTKVLAVAGTADAAVLLDLNGQSPPIRLAGHTAPVSALTAAGGVVATAARDRSVLLWHRPEATWTPLSSIASGDNVCSLVIEISCQFLAAGTFSGELLILNLGAATAWQTSSPAHGAAVRCLLSRPRHGQLISGGDDGWILVWNVPALRLLGRVHVGFPVTSLTEDAAGHLIVGTQFGDVIVLEEIDSSVSSIKRQINKCGTHYDLP